MTIKAVHPKSQSKRYLLRFLKIGLGFIFLYASLPKIFDPFGFAIAIGNYRLLPEPFLYPVAALLPFLEFLVGLSLITGYFLKGGLLLAFVSLITFTLALILNFIRGIHVDCGCFSLKEDHVSSLTMLWYILRDLILIACTLLIIKSMKVFKENQK